ncbi:MAG: UDP-N-acetylmuramoyl-tripeptide--D-alanyl-D-alanine ligase [Acidobacteria bacterium]|nr:MAG: UDP-N-acetylmuramoyl-tripeptide--D-alanyl-D-alanine ligase [Acidobacteriota bacterium]
MRWTVQEIARALGVAVPAGLAPVARLAGVSIDSRAVGRGQLFVAICGPRHNGHDFVAAALQAGAEAAVVASERISSYPAEIRGRLFAVGDTLAALQELAQAVRRAWGRRIAAVTGSVGKTTTKEILAALLGAQFRVLKSEGNLNNEYGLPLTLLRLDPEDEAAVVELGMSRRGELRRLAEIAEPEVGLVTRVAPVHLEFFASIDEIALAKRELIEGLAGPENVAVLNADDPRVARFAEVARGRVLTFGYGSSAQFRAEKILDHGAAGSEFDFVAPGERARLALALPGRHSIENALAALAASSVWGIGAAEASDVLRDIKVGEMRGKLLQFAAGFALINDSYNSNPVALAAMVDLLAHTRPKTGNYRRRILAAGEMLELGPASPNLHREAGRYAASQRIDSIVAVQGNAVQIANGAIAAGMPASQAHFFPDSSVAAAFLAGMVQPGDLVLVKGSRGVKMERIAEALRAKYPLADEVPAPAVPQGHN